MQQTKNSQTTKTCILTFAKEIGALWILKDITPFHWKFPDFFDKILNNDILALTTIGVVNDVLDILAGDDRILKLELILASGRRNLPDCVEFSLVDPGNLAAKYYVDNCPGRPRMVGWVNATAKEFFNGFPAFAYIRKK